MRLSELCGPFPIEVRRDAKIASLGFVEIPLDRRLVFVVDGLFLRRLREVRGVAAVLTSRSLADAVDPELGLLVSNDPRRAFVELHNHLVASGFYAEPKNSTISPSVRLHPRATVSQYGVSIADRCTIDANAVVEAGTNLAAGVRIMPGAVLGSDGFQTMRFEDGPIDLAHAGGLIIGERSVVMANAVIARAVFRQSTEIGTDCKIGNGAFISHNARIGDRTLIGHGSVVAGNCTIGSDVTIGPGAICLDRLHIQDRAFVTAGSVVTRSVGSGERVSGNFAVRHEILIDFVKQLAAKS